MHRKNKIKVILCGGGTGGHIFPMISIANELKNENKENEILFVGSRDRMEMEIVPKHNFKIIGLWISGIKRSSILLNILFAGIPFFLQNLILAGLGAHNKKFLYSTLIVLAPWSFIFGSVGQGVEEIFINKSEWDAPKFEKDNGNSNKADATKIIDRCGDAILDYSFLDSGIQLKIDRKAFRGIHCAFRNVKD